MVCTAGCLRPEHVSGGGGAHEVCRFRCRREKQRCRHIYWIHRVPSFVTISSRLRCRIQDLTQARSSRLPVPSVPPLLPPPFPAYTCVCQTLSLSIMGTLCTTFETHIVPTPTSNMAPFPWHWPIIKHYSTLALTRRSVKSRCIKSLFFAWQRRTLVLCFGHHQCVHRLSRG